MPTTPRDLNLTQFKEPTVTDVDSGITAIHHTLGPEAFQSSPGSHRHDGSDSNKIKYSDIEGTPDGFAGSAGSVVLSGIAILDFGSGSVSAQTTITGQTGVTANSVILVALRVIATTEHTAEDILIDPIRVAVKNIVAGVGFTIDGRMDNAQANGTYKVNWVLIG
jgi:hypothetical protein